MNGMQTELRKCGESSAVVSQSVEPALRGWEMVWVLRARTARQWQDQSRGCPLLWPCDKGFLVPEKSAEHEPAVGVTLTRFAATVLKDPLISAVRAASKLSTLCTPRPAVPSLSVLPQVLPAYLVPISCPSLLFSPCLLILPFST